MEYNEATPNCVTGVKSVQYQADASIPFMFASLQVKPLKQNHNIFKRVHVPILTYNINTLIHDLPVQFHGMTTM